MTAEEKARIERVIGRTLACSGDCSGLHHVPTGKGIVWAEWYATVTVHEGLDTFDSDRLTRLVIAAHEECIRVEVLAGGPRYLRLHLSPRVREGSFSKRHPTIEQAIERYRRRPSAPPPDSKVQP